MRVARFLHTPEGGNPEAAVRNINPVLFVEPPQRIPAFERVKKLRHAATLRHSRESGNPGAPVRYIGPFFLVETP